MMYYIRLVILIELKLFFNSKKYLCRHCKFTLNTFQKNVRKGQIGCQFNYKDLECVIFKNDKINGVYD